MHPDSCYPARLALCSSITLHCMCAAGEMLHVAEQFLDINLHPTVIIRGYIQALEAAVKIIDRLAFDLDVEDTDQMLKIISSCIGTKFTSRFGNLVPVRPCAELVQPGLLPNHAQPDCNGAGCRPWHWMRSSV